MINRPYDDVSANERRLDSGLRARIEKLQGRWENTWLIFQLCLSLVVLPWALSVTLVQHLFQTYTELTASQFAVPILFGAGWWKDALRFARACEPWA